MAKKGIRVYTRPRTVRGGVVWECVRPQWHAIWHDHLTTTAFHLYGTLVVKERVFAEEPSAHSFRRRYLAVRNIWLLRRRLRIAWRAYKKGCRELELFVPHKNY